MTARRKKPHGPPVEMSDELRRLLFAELDAAELRLIAAADVLERRQTELEVQLVVRDALASAVATLRERGLVE